MPAYFYQKMKIQTEFIQFLKIITNFLDIPKNSEYNYQQSSVIVCI